MVLAAAGEAVLQTLLEIVELVHDAFLLRTLVHLEVNVGMRLLLQQVTKRSATERPEHLVLDLINLPSLLKLLAALLLIPTIHLVVILDNAATGAIVNLAKMFTCSTIRPSSNTPSKLPDLLLLHHLLHRRLILHLLILIRSHTSSSHSRWPSPRRTPCLSPTQSNQRLSQSTRATIGRND